MAWMAADIMWQGALFLHALPSLSYTEIWRKAIAKFSQFMINVTNIGHKWPHAVFDIYIISQKLRLHIFREI